MVSSDLRGTIPKFWHSGPNLRILHLGDDSIVRLTQNNSKIFALRSKSTYMSPRWRWNRETYVEQFQNFGAQVLWRLKVGQVLQERVDRTSVRVVNDFCLLRTAEVRSVVTQERVDRTSVRVVHNFCLLRTAETRSVVTGSSACLYSFQRLWVFSRCVAMIGRENVSYLFGLKFCLGTMIDISFFYLSFFFCLVTMIDISLFYLSFIFSLGALRVVSFFYWSFCLGALITILSGA